MKFEELSQEEQDEYIEMSLKAFKEKNFKEVKRLAKMYELSPRVARGIKLAQGSDMVNRMKDEGYLFPEGV